MEESGERARSATLITIDIRHSSMQFEVINTQIVLLSLVNERLSLVSVSDFPCGVLYTSFRVALGSTKENEVSQLLIFPLRFRLFIFHVIRRDYRHLVAFVSYRAVSADPCHMCVTNACRTAGPFPKTMLISVLFHDPQS